MSKSCTQLYAEQKNFSIKSIIYCNELKMQMIPISSQQNEKL